MIDTLKAYALANYEAGGHWIAETYDTADYVRALEKAGGSVSKAKAALKNEWLILNDRAADCGDY